MSELDGIQISPESFDGVVRLFPLPNLIVFPHIVQALHVFEPRYRDLLKDTLGGDRLIGMGLLAPGWEPDYEGCPAIRDVICIGRVISCSKLEDDRYNVLLLGLRRARVIQELSTPTTFRKVQVELLEDVYPEVNATNRPRIRRRLMNCFRQIVPKAPAAQAHLEQLLGSQVPLGVLTDLVAYSLHIDLEEKRRLLEEVDVDRRAEWLLKHLDAVLHKPAHGVQGIPSVFPPEFSVN